MLVSLVGNLAVSSFGCIFSSEDFICDLNFEKIHAMNISCSDAPISVVIIDFIERTITGLKIVF